MDHPEKDTPTRILDAAELLFGDRDPAAVSASDIAHAAGVNKALIFYHFGSMERLYRALFLHWIEKLSLEVITTAEPGLASIEQFIRGHIAMLSRHQHMIRIIARELASGNPAESVILAEAKPYMGRTRDMLIDALDAARERGEIRDVDPWQTIVSIISLDIFFLMGKPIVSLLMPDIDIDRFNKDRVNTVVDLIMNGLKKRGEETP